MPPISPKFILKRNHSASDGAQRALTLFQQAAQYIPAYKDFLKKHKVNPTKIRTVTDLRSVPFTDKANYISQYPLSNLCWGGSLTNLSYIVSSSGSTGTPYYWPRGEVQDRISALIYLEIFRDIFNLNHERTLLMNSYGQGSWIAGTELYNSARFISEFFPNFTVVNSGIDPELVISQISQLSKLYKKIIICGYPPFLKDIIELGHQKKIAWKDLDVCLVGAGEGISPAWRKYIADRLKHSSKNKIINLYGLADAGIVAAESPLTIAIQNYFRQREMNLPTYLGGEKTLSLLQYHPDLRYFEVDNDRIILSTYAGTPLIRYDTKDRGGIITADALMTELQTNPLSDKKFVSLLHEWHAPLLYLFGRLDLSVTLYAVNIYPENIRSILESQLQIKKITSRFVMQVKQNSKFDQYLQITIELAQGYVADENLRKLLKSRIVTQLRQLNSEYNELYTKVGQKVAPHLVFKEFGSIGYVAGRKHRWVKQD